MTVQGIGGSGAYGYIAPDYRSGARPTPVAATPASSKTAKANGSDPVQEFLNYMKETPAQRLEDTWLAGHHLTRKQLDAMPAKEREAILKQMASEIQEQVKHAALDKASRKGGILV